MSPVLVAALLVTATDVTGWPHESHREDDRDPCDDGL